MPSVAYVRQMKSRKQYQFVGRVRLEDEWTYSGAMVPGMVIKLIRLQEGGNRGLQESRHSWKSYRSKPLLPRHFADVRRNQGTDVRTLLVVHTTKQM